jgi:cobalamin biosynthesis protein CobT
MMEEEAKKQEEEEKQADPNQQQASPQDQSGSGNQQEDDQQKGQNNPLADDQGDDQQSGQSSSSSVQNEAVDDGAEEEVKSFLRQVLESGDEDGLADIKDALVQACETAVSEGRVDTVGAPFPTKFLSDQTPKNSTDMLEVVQSATNALKVRTGALLQAETKATKRNVQQGTRIDPRKLHRAPTGGAIFQKVKAGKKIDTAIMVLIDRSDSMEGEPIHLATQAALASTLAFDHRGVETAVMAFPYDINCNVMLKSFTDRASAQVDKYEVIGVDGTTPMAEAMMGAGIELANHRFQRKIMLVATDGEPDNLKSTKEVIDLARRSNIEILGLGINIDVSHVFGENFSSSVKNIDELPQAMIQVLSASVFN